MTRETRDNAKKRSTLRLRMGSPHRFPPEAFGVLVVHTVRVENSRLMVSSSSWKTFILSAHLRRYFGKDRSGEKGPSLECPGRPEMPWPSSEGGCGCLWCSSSCGALAASTPASARRPPGGTFEVAVRLGPEWYILSPGRGGEQR